uniref:Uncharacterized protein n=1 Tax=Oryctolagus cuniculus TaxID=9986 RepID=A0A5F9DVW8_RABIT
TRLEDKQDMLVVSREPKEEEEEEEDIHCTEELTAFLRARKHCVAHKFLSSLK